MYSDVDQAGVRARRDPAPLIPLPHPPNSQQYASVSVIPLERQPDTFFHRSYPVEIWEKIPLTSLSVVLNG